MKILHDKYIEENEHFQISYSVFCRLRPFWTVAPTEKDRETCLCKICENGRYLAECLKNYNVLDTNNLSELCKRVVCSTLNKDCMYGTCKQCCNKKLVSKTVEETKQVTWNQWISVKESRTFKTGEEKEITLVKKELKVGTIRTAVSDLEHSLKPKITKHLFNIQNQFKYYQQLKQELTDNECLIHIDYAENYVGKYHEEIQSVHFGASQPQISLHTGVYFTKDLPGGSTFCTLSDSLQHGPSAIWTYIRPVLNDIKTKHPNINYIHFFSDGPVTQYKQKKNFYLLSSEIFKMGFEGACWNFHESGHGKGTPDAVGGSLKRTADTRVRCGEDITCAAKFKEILDKTGTTVTLFVTDPKEVMKSEEEHDKFLKQLKAIPNTLQIHQIKTTSPSTVLFRDVSCNCGFKSEVICKGHNFKERKFPVAAKPTEPVRCKKIPKTKHQELDDTIYSCSLKEKQEDDKENATNFSMCSEENSYTRILEKLSKCKDYNDFKEQCKAIQIGDVQGQERSILECKSTVDQNVMDLCPDDIPSKKNIYPTIVRADGDCLPGCGSVFVYGDDSHATELRLRIILELVLHEDYYMERKHFEVATSSGKIRDLRKSLAMYSEVPGIRLDDQLIKRIYQQEIMSIAKPKNYMGMWQMYGLASVLKMNICSCYPKRGNPNIREDLHRLIKPRMARSLPIATSSAIIMWSSTRSDMVEKHWVPNHFLPILPVDNDCSGVVEIENGHDDLNLPKCDDIFDMLFDLQNIDSTENDFKHVDIEIGKLTKTETRMEQENNKIRTKMNFEDIQVKNETVFEGNQMETENDMENQEIDIENDHETTSAAHNMENQQRDIENDLETTSAAPDDVAFAIEEFTVGQFVYVEYDDQNYPGKILKLNESLKELYVQCMKKVNKNSSLYMWPRKKDFCWFPLDAVNKIIPPPRFIDGTNHYTME
jgi:hypothetical protein